MNVRSPGKRLAWAILALVQLFVVAAVPAADAALESGDARVVHVEGESSDACALRHDHRYCQLCRLTAFQGPPAEQCDRYRVTGPAVLSAPQPHPSFVRSGDPGLPALGPRAPPQV